MGTGQKFVFYKMDVSNVTGNVGGVCMRLIFDGPKIVALSTIYNIPNPGKGSGVEVFDNGLLSFRESNRSYCEIAAEVCFHCYIVQGLIVSCNFYNNSCDNYCGFLLSGSQVNIYRCNIFDNNLKVSTAMVYSLDSNTLIYLSIVIQNNVNCYFKGVNGVVTLLQCKIDRNKFCQGVVNADFLPFEEAPNASIVILTVESSKCDICSLNEIHYNFISKSLMFCVFIFNLKEP